MCQKLVINNIRNGCYTIKYIFLAQNTSTLENDIRNYSMKCLLVGIKCIGLVLNATIKVGKKSDLTIFWYKQLNQKELYVIFLV